MLRTSVAYALFLLPLLASFGGAQPRIAATPGDTAKSIQKYVLFRSGEDGYSGYRIPSLLVTSQPGTVLAFAEARHELDGHGIPFPDCTDTDIVMRGSTDGGRTWSPMQVIADFGKVTTGNPCPVLDRDTGAIWLVFCRGIEPGKGNHNRMAHVMKSTDEGLTWSEAVDITNAAKDPAWRFVFTGPGHGIQLRTGRLLIPCAAEYGAVQFSFMLYSDDHGTTWQRGEALLGEDTLDASVAWQKLGPKLYSAKDVADECDVVELKDGRVYFNARSRLEVGHRAYAYSSDGGITWSEVKFHPELPESVVDGGLARLPDENVVLVSCPTFLYKKGMSYGGMWSHRRDLSVSLSYDDGQTWPVSRLIHEGPSAYSDLAVTPDGEIFCFYEGGKEFRYESMILARFGLAWVGYKPGEGK